MPELAHIGTRGKSNWAGEAEIAAHQGTLIRRRLASLAAVIDLAIVARRRSGPGPQAGLTTRLEVSAFGGQVSPGVA